jgi:23S rRNA (cytidine2498-2'-O)-methyltransferase
MHLLLAAEDSVPELSRELSRTFPGHRPFEADSMLLKLDVPITRGERLPYLAYARQLLPEASFARAESVRGWAAVLFESVASALPEDAPWRLHVEPRYHSEPRHRIGARAWHSATRQKAQFNGPEAGHHSEPGRNRCSLIRKASLEMLQKKRRHLLRRLREEAGPFGPDESLVQLLLTGPETGFVSAARAPLPFEQRHLISFFPRGEVECGPDKAAPSRAFAKLLEAEARMGRAVKPGETCVDLGAAPGSWTYVAAKRNARVIAVDRSPLADFLMQNPLVDFRSGDAFRFEPEHSMGWLLCDVIAAPERSAELLLRWLKRRWCRRFVVTIKMKDETATDVLESLKRELPPLCSELFLTRLCANKKEVCAFGSV